MVKGSNLIVNADDFGLTRGVNRAIAELYDAGVLTSTTLMACGTAFGDAVDLARARPNFGVGCHIVLTDGTPSAPPKSIPSLMARNRSTLRPKLHSFLAAALTNQIDPSDIEREAVAQIGKLQEQGIRITHLDTHKHTHLLPMVLRPLLRAAVRMGIPAIRNPFEQPWAFAQSNAPKARDLQLRMVQILKRQFFSQPEIRSGQVHTTDGTIGVSATGTLDDVALRNLLRAIPAGTWELVCHPGYNDTDLDGITTRLRASRDVERRALLAVLSEIEVSHSDVATNRSCPGLIHYGSLK